MKIFYKKLLVIITVLIISLFIINSLFFAGPFLYAGTLEATKVDLSARVAATISQMYVQEGDRIQKGKILVSLSCEDYKINARLAQQNYERYIKLLEPGWTTPETIDQLKDLKEDAETRLSWCTLTSPIEGKILSRYHEPGEWVNPGTKILTLANIRDIWAYIYVPQPLIAKLALGMKVKAYLPELDNREFEGTIIKINDEAEFTPKNVQTQTERERLIYGVKINFFDTNADEILKPGMTVEVLLPQ